MEYASIMCGKCEKWIENFIRKKGKGGIIWRNRSIWDGNRPNTMYLQENNFMVWILLMGLMIGCNLGIKLTW